MYDYGVWLGGSGAIFNVVRKVHIHNFLNNLYQIFHVYRCIPNISSLVYPIGWLTFVMMVLTGSSPFSLH